MSTFLLYIARSSLYLALFYAFFLLVMRRTTFFRLNRILLLVGALACFLLPLLRLRPDKGAHAFWLILNPEIAAAAEGTATDTAPAGIPVTAILFTIWLLGAATVLSLTIRSYFKMRKLIRQGEVQRLPDGTILILTDQDQPSFSWNRTVVMSRKDAAENPAILLHEQMHIRHRHSLDLLLYSFCTAAHWFNPLVWITRTELKLLHEYEADDSVLDQGIDATQYQLLLVRKAVGEQRFSLANGFQHSKLKNRINMMLKKQTPGWMRLAYILVLPVLAGAMFACNPAREQQEPEPVPDTFQIATETGEGSSRSYSGSLRDVIDKLEGINYDENELKVLRDLADRYDEAKGKADEETRRSIFNQFMNKLSSITASLRNDGADVVGKTVTKADVSDEEAVPFSLLEVKPTFNGENANAFSEWVNSHLKYPEDAKAAGEQGRVTLQFTIGTDGVVSNVKILRGVSESLDAEALRVVSSSPDWGPGKVNGKPVPVTFTFPVVFKLK